MKWLKYKIETTTEAVEAVTNRLYELNIYGVEIRDKVPLTENEKKQMFVDILPENTPDDGISEIYFYIEKNDEEASDRSAMYNSGTEIEEPSCIDSAEVVKEIRKVLNGLSEFMNVGSGYISVSEVDESEWAYKWKEFFHSFKIGENIIIAPTWEEPENLNENDILIRIDPGMAFGTGAHETTKLCIEALQKYVKKGDELLDVGTGSGILIIAALKLGAEGAYGIDIDPVAVTSAEENLERNGILKTQARLEAGNILEDEDLRLKVGERKYDIITANILAPVLITLTPIITPVLKDGGYYICSGIAEEFAEGVISAVKESGLSLISDNRENGWVSLTARKE